MFITARRIPKYTSTLYIPDTIHRVDYYPTDDSGQTSLQPPFVSNLSAHVAQYSPGTYRQRLVLCTFLPLSRRRVNTGNETYLVIQCRAQLWGFKMFR